MCRFQAFGVALLLGLALACVTERRVEDELEDANYCDITEDCIIVDPGCPLACHAPINKAEKAEIEKLLERYHRQHRDDCADLCENIGNVYCLHGECIILDPNYDGI